MACMQVGLIVVQRDYNELCVGVARTVSLRINDKNIPKKLCSTGYKKGTGGA